MKALVCSVAFSLAAVCLASAGEKAASGKLQNWISNGSLEKDSKGRPAGWRPHTWNGKGQFEYARSGHTGRSVEISSDQGGDLSWTTTATIEPYARYRLSGWIKTEKLEIKGGRGALLNLHNLQPIATKALTGTQDWTRVEVEFDTEEQDSVQVNCLFGGWGLATGKAWFDDLSLEVLSRQTPPSPGITLEVTRTGQPISKYVYGQFIEHLGRCIYGGIWAEMLEDRKFYHPVGHKESPWKALGDARVEMDKHQPFVGQHTPRVQLGEKAGGLVQGGLGLLAGKKYAGRIWLSGSPEAAPLQVSLVWGDGAQKRQTVTVAELGPKFVRTPLEFTAGQASDDGRLEIVASGKGSFSVGTVSLMPADNIEGMRVDTLALLKRLDSPVYRWPGGNFVSGYNWRDGIGDPDRRPPRKNPAWLGVEHNDFGLDEFMVFCRYLGTDPYIAVNSGLGEVQEAVEEVQYANGAPGTPMGKLRARYGHAEPYAVRFWSIGNEMYGGWQLGHMPLAKYVEKHNRFAVAMRRADPSIRLIAVGDAGPWSEGMLRSCADHMELISEHFYCQERPGLYAHVRQIPQSVASKAEAHRRYRRELESLKGKDIRIALDEWNYWYGKHEFGELGTRYFLKDGLGIAAGLHEMARHSDLFFMANYAQTVNVIGCIKTSKTAAAFESTGLVLELYRQRFGTLPVATHCSRPLDAQGAWSADRKMLTLGVVNPTLEPAEVPLKIKGAKLKGTATRWQMADRDPMVYNDPADPQRLKFEEAKVAVKDKLTLGPCSVSLWVFEVE